MLLIFSSLLSNYNAFSCLIHFQEAHCISGHTLNPVLLFLTSQIAEWGTSFRPAYRELHRLREVSARVPIMALTATATVRVRQVFLSM